MYSGVPPWILHLQKPLPILCSIEIVVLKFFHCAHILTFFKDAPQLRIVCLQGEHTLVTSLTPPLPLSQFTRLKFCFPIELFVLEAILTQCGSLEEFLSDGWIAEDGDRAPLLILVSKPPGSEYHGGLFHIAHSNRLVRPIQIPSPTSQTPSREPEHGCAPVLRRLPTLETLDLGPSCLNDALVAALTYNPENPVHSLTLPRLRSMTFRAKTGQLDGGSSIAAIVQSARMYGEGWNAAFPALASVDLWLDGWRFDNDVEACLAAARATSLVTDHHAQFRKS
ncbi:hypothetical protein DFH09DRAFT_1406093 [Mycena vulgaris]|nr:hypothetical protein DFH09DRAFT_1406093 [Mycena vulgaris]